jgi:hypothetical protein
MPEIEIGYVVDTLAVTAARKHAITEQSGIVTYYELKANEFTKMPRDHAMRFLCDPAFVVKDVEGKVMRPVAKKEHTSHVQIPAGFVIAELAELSREALFIRCKLCVGSESVHPKKTPVADMIEFLNRNATTPGVITPEVIGDVDLGASSDELDAMFGKE